MAVVILLILWIGVLTPLWLKRRRERRGQSSIDTFHHQLHLLERTGPKLVPPAHRLQTAWSHTGLAPGESGYPALSSVPLVAGVAGEAGAGHGGALHPGALQMGEAPGTAATPALPARRPSLVLLDGAPLEPAGSTARAGGAPVELPPGGWGHGAAQRARLEHRRQARRRRRDIVLGLVCVAVLTAAVGSVHGLHALWALSVLAVLGVCGCVALAAYAELIEADRRALRPIVPAQVPVEGKPPVAPGWEMSPYAARAGYPGAWDEEMPASRAAAGG